jgi:hypothetical protein
MSCASQVLYLTEIVMLFINVSSRFTNSGIKGPRKMSKMIDTALKLFVANVLRGYESYIM